MNEISNEDLQLVDRLGVNEDRTVDGVKVKEFVVGEEWKYCTRDLSRYLRRDKPENLSYSRKLGFMRVVETKLIPLSMSNEGDLEIQSQVAKLIYYLTLPPEIELEAQYKTEVIIYQRKYLSFIIEKKYISIMMMMMGNGLTPNEKGEYDYEDIKTIDLILHIFRNLLLIPNDPDPSSLHHSIHEKLIIELKKEYVIDTICLICETLDIYKQPTWNILLLEIFTFLLNNYDTKLISIFNNLQKKEELSEKKRIQEEMMLKRIEEVRQDERLSNEMKEVKIRLIRNEKKNNNKQSNKEPSPLLALLAKEKQQQSLIMNNLSSRHSRFGGLLQKKTDMGNQLLSLQSVVNRNGIINQKPVTSVKYTAKVDDDKMYLSNDYCECVIEITEQFLNDAFFSLITRVVNDLRINNIDLIGDNDHNRYIMLLDYVTEFYHCLILQKQGYEHRQKENNNDIINEKCKIQYTPTIFEELLKKPIDFDRVKHLFSKQIILYLQKRLLSYLNDKQRPVDDIETVMKFFYHYIRLLVVVNNGEYGKLTTKTNGLLRYIYSQQIVWKVPELLRTSTIQNSSEDFISNLILISDLLLDKGEKYYNEGNITIQHVSMKKKKDGTKQRVIHESIFDYTQFVELYIHYKVLINYRDLLMKYSTNLYVLNICISKFIYRISTYKIFEQTMDTVFFHISYLTLFNSIIQDRLFNDNKQNKYIIDVVRNVVHSFFKFSKDHYPIYADLLFWKKSIREYAYISNGYKEQEKPTLLSLYNETEYNDDEIEQRIWKEEEIEILKNKYEEMKEINTREEIITMISKEEGLSSYNRNENRIEVKLMELGLIERVVKHVEVDWDIQSKEIDRCLRHIRRYPMSDEWLNNIVSELENCLEYRKEKDSNDDIDNNEEEGDKMNETTSSDSLLNDSTIIPPNSVNTSIDNEKNDNNTTIDKSTAEFLSEINDGNISIPVSPIRSSPLDNSFDSEGPTQIIAPLSSQEEEEKGEYGKVNKETESLDDSIDSTFATQLVDESERNEEYKKEEIEEEEKLREETQPIYEKKENRQDESYEIQTAATDIHTADENEKSKSLPKDPYEMKLTVPTIDKHINTLIRLIGCNKSNNKWILGNEVDNKLLKNIIRQLSGKSEVITSKKRRKFDEFIADDDEVLDYSDSDDDDNLLLMKPNKKKIEENMKKKKVNKENELESDSETEKEMSDIDTDTEETTLKGYDSDIPTDDEEHKEEIQKKVKKYKMKLLEKNVKKTKVEKKRKRYELSDNPELPLPKKIKRKSLQQSPLKRLDKKGKFSKVFDDDEDLSDLSEDEVKIGNNNGNMILSQPPTQQQQQQENEVSSSDDEIIRISPKRKRNSKDNSNKRLIKKAKKNNNNDENDILSDNEDNSIITPPKKLSKLHHSQKPTINNDDDDIENLDDDDEDDFGSNISSKTKNVVELNEPSSIGDISEDITSD